MEQIKIDRINELSRKSKTTGLTSEEKREQQELRSQYVSEFRSNLKSMLDTVVVVDKDGNKSPIKMKQNPACGKQEN